MTTYFGFTNGTSYIGVAAPYFVMNNETYVCPGSGSQNIQELSIDAQSSSGTATHVRLAVYDTGPTLVAEGAAEVSITETAGYQGHMTQASVKAAGGSSPGVLTGGASYFLIAGIDAATYSQYFGYQSGYGAEACGQGTTDYTGGWPSSGGDIAWESDDTLKYRIRCGVDPAEVDVNVSASSKSLSLTEKSASVKNNVSVTAASESLSLTDYAASVKENVNASCSSAALSILANAPTVDYTPVSQFILTGSRIADASRSWQVIEDADVADWNKMNPVIIAAMIERA